MFFITAGARFASPNWASGVISDMRPVRKKKKNLFGASAEHPRAAFIDDAQGALGGCFGDV